MLGKYNLFIVNISRISLLKWITRRILLALNLIKFLVKNLHKNKFLIMWNQILKIYLKDLISLFLHMVKQDLVKLIKCLDQTEKEFMIKAQKIRAILLKIHLFKI